jgi:hypothetical protein
MEATPPQLERDEVETTVHGTTTFRTYINGLGTISPMEMTLLANLSVGSTHMTLRSYLDSQDELWWRFEVPVSPNLATTQYIAYEFQGRVGSWSLGTPIDDAKTIDVIVRCTSVPVVYQEMASQL